MPTQQEVRNFESELRKKLSSRLASAGRQKRERLQTEFAAELDAFKTAEADNIFAASRGDAAESALSQFRQGVSLLSEERLSPGKVSGDFGSLSGQISLLTDEAKRRVSQIKGRLARPGRRQSITSPLIR